MKNFCILLLCVLLSGGVFAQKKGEGVNFQGLTFERALKKAKANKKGPKMVFVDCYTTWCGPCQNMTKNVFTQKICGDYFNANFICVKYDMEEEGAEYGKKWGVRAFPTFIIFNADGEEINRLVGGNSPEKFIESVKKAVTPGNTMKDLKAAYEAEKSVKTGMPYLKALSEAYLPKKELAIELYDIANVFEKCQPEFVKLILGSISYKDPIFTDIIMNKAAIAKSMGSEIYASTLLNTYANTLYNIYSKERKYSAEDLAAIERLAIAIATSGAENVDQVTCHLGQLALYADRKDVDGLIKYFVTKFNQAPENRQSKMLEEVFKKILSKATPEQQAAGKKYFEMKAKKANNAAAYYQKMCE